MSSKFKIIIIICFLFIIIVLTTIPIIIKNKISVPSKGIKLDSILVEKGFQTSGVFGFEILKNISKTTRDYNSNQNLKINRYLNQILGNIVKSYSRENTVSDSKAAAELSAQSTAQSAATSAAQSTAESDSNTAAPSKNTKRYCSNLAENFITIDNGQYSNNGNIQTSLDFSMRNVYFESNNVVVKFQGLRNESLLISSHYDSGIESFGATDDGIAVASMISTIYALSRYTCNITLPYSIIFNFNNGEELGLFGGAAFTLHPLYKDVKAFINLEGAGVSEENPSFLFRSNSFELVSLLLSKAPYPHGSIIANNIMRFLQSDTDFRPYSREKPGVDYAFYSHRYLYHSSLDDINHTSVNSLQHMADNLLKGIYDIMQSNILPTIKIDPELPYPANNRSLLIPAFTYYDRMGLYGVAIEANQYILDYGVLLFLITSFAYFKLSFSTDKSPKIASIMRSFALVLFVFFAVLAAIIAVSALRMTINPGATYGSPELTNYSTLTLVLLVLCAISTVTDRIYAWNSAPLFHRLSYSSPVSASAGADVVPGDINATFDRVSRSPSPNLSMVIGGDSSEMDVSISPTSGVSGASPVGVGYHYQLEPITRVPGESPDLIHGLLTLWLVMSTITLFAAIAGVSCFYFIFDCTSYYFLSVLLFQLLEWISNGSTAYQERLLIFQVITSSAIPIILFYDIGSMLLIGIPAVIGEGVSPLIVDSLFGIICLFSFINLLPLFSLGLVDKTKFITIVGGIFTVLLLIQLALFPYSIDRPFKYDFRETWNVTDSTSSLKTKVSITVMFGMDISTWYNHHLPSTVLAPIPNVTFIGKRRAVFDNFKVPTLLPSESPSSLITTHNETFKNDAFSGIILGPRGSRACHIFLDKLNNPELTFEIAGDWQTYSWFNGSTTRDVVSIYRRAFDAPDHPDRIRIEFIIGNVFRDTPIVFEIMCMLSLMNSSPIYKTFKNEKKEWTLNGIGLNDGGAFRILKTLLFQKKVKL